MPASPVPLFARCPTCSGLFGRWLKASSEMAAVHYYRCDHCGGVWTVPKTAAELRRYVTRNLRTPEPPAAK
jgi:hypothetical protein